MPRPGSSAGSRSLSPALTLSREEIDRIVAILRDAIEATMAELD